MLLRFATGSGVARSALRVLEAARKQALPIISSSIPSVLHLRRSQTTSAPAGICTHYPGAPKAEYTSKLDIARDSRVLPIYRILDETGKIVNEQYKFSLPKEQVIRMYECMVRLNVMDQVFYDAQRQGRISFYMTSSGEEATATCSAAALEAEDLIMCQYREAGAFMWRGFSIGQFADQCFSNAKDKGKGRQMPVHYGSAALHIQTVSSPLTTQVPQASGAAYAFKINNKQNVVCCYFGEGAASEGDFHAGLNFAATLNCPVLFFCRNNGYAISTPSSEQYKGDGIASRGAGYGMRTIRIDGNDFLAVFEATREARRLSLEHSVPVLIEAMTYRGGHHSTSDDSTRYRSQEEIRYWQENNNPLVRTRMFMEGQQWWDATQEVKLQQDARQVVLAELSRAEHEKKPAIDHLFTDVYDKMPRNLQEQQAELHAHLAKHGQHYDLGAFETDEASPAK